MRFLPQLALTLFAGAAADAFDRRKIAMMAQAGPFLAGALLFTLTVRHEIICPAFTR